MDDALYAFAPDTFDEDVTLRGDACSHGHGRGISLERGVTSPCPKVQSGSYRNNRSQPSLLDGKPQRNINSPHLHLQQKLLAEKQEKLPRSVHELQEVLISLLIESHVQEID